LQAVIDQRGVADQHRAKNPLDGGQSAHFS
jgi:hypothetical protein